MTGAPYPTLGVSHLKNYDRMEFEALYVYRVNGPLIKTIELNYRRFQELDAPAEVRAANLRVHELGTVRVNLAEPFFVSYSAGRQPFNIKKDETVTFGFTTNLKDLAGFLGGAASP